MSLLLFSQNLKSKFAQIIKFKTSRERKTLQLQQNFSSTWNSEQKTFPHFVFVCVCVCLMQLNIDRPHTKYKLSFFFFAACYNLEFFMLRNPIKPIAKCGHKFMWIFFFSVCVKNPNCILCFFYDLFGGNWEKFFLHFFREVRKSKLD